MRNKDWRQGVKIKETYKKENWHKMNDPSYAGAEQIAEIRCDNEGNFSHENDGGNY